MRRGSAGSGGRNIWPIVAGQSVSLLGDYVAILALPLFILDLTGSALDLGLTTAAETLPTILFGFAAGVALDRVSIRRALIIADLGRAGAFGVLALAVVAEVSAVWMVFAAAFLVGSMSVLFESGLQAWLPSLLPDDALVAVNTKLQFVRTGAWTIGPPLAAFLATSGGGFAVAFAVDAATFLVSAVFILMLAEIRPRLPVEHPPWLESFRMGIGYLWRQPVLRSATAAATLINFTFVPMEVLLVLFARDSLDIPEALLGWFFAGHGVLGAVGVMLAPRLARTIGLGRAFILGPAMLGGGFFVLVLAADAIASLPSLASAVVGALPAGIAVAGVSVANVAFFTLRQQIPPRHLLGRVIAASRTLSWAGVPLGAALGGALGRSYGVDPVYLVTSLVLLVVATALTVTALWTHAVDMVIEQDTVADGA
jgi:MFS family permease